MSLVLSVQSLTNTFSTFVFESSSEVFSVFDQLAFFIFTVNDSTIIVEYFSVRIQVVFAFKKAISRCARVTQSLSSIP